MIENKNIQLRNDSLEWECLAMMVNDVDKRIMGLEKLTENSFTSYESIEVFRVVKRAVTNNSRIDLFLVESECAKNNIKIDITKLMGLQSNLIENLSLKLREYEIIRAVNTFSMDLRNKLHSNVDALDIADFATAKAGLIMDLTDVSKKRELVDITKDAVQRIEDASNGISAEVLKTNHRDYDRVVQGYERGQFAIQGGRPGMGKSTIMYSQSLNMARQGYRTVMMSLEVGDIKLVTKMLSNISEVGSDTLKKGNLSVDEWARLRAAKDELDNLDLHILDLSGPTLEEVTLAIKKVHLQKPIDICYIDYLQIMSGQGNDQQIATKNSKGLKQIAKGLNIVIVALSQLSRNIESRVGLKVPKLSDLRDSGSLEQDADIVTFVYRPDYYGDDEVENFNATYDKDCAGKVMLIVAKNREGELGVAEMKYQFQFSRFIDVEEDFISDKVNFDNVKEDFKPTVIPEDRKPNNLDNVPF